MGFQCEHSLQLASDQPRRLHPGPEAAVLGAQTAALFLWDSHSSNVLDSSWVPSVGLGSGEEEKEKAWSLPSGSSGLARDRSHTERTGGVELSVGAEHAPLGIRGARS